MIGCELGGATKNVIALAVGMAVGLGLGANATASVITRGLAEISRLGEALGADPQTFSGLAGLGDLVATCSSPLSRNRTFGEELGKGRTVAEIIASTRQVAEGVKSCSSITDLAARHRIETADRRAGRRGDRRRTHPRRRDHRPDVRARPTRTLLTTRVRSVELVSACSRSAHRSSTCSTPTDIRIKPSGTVGQLAGPAAAAFEHRLHAAEAGREHPQPQASMSGSAVAASASSIDSRVPKPAIPARPGVTGIVGQAGIADPWTAGWAASRSARIGGVGLRLRPAAPGRVRSPRRTR